MRLFQFTNSAFAKRGRARKWQQSFEILEVRTLLAAELLTIADPLLYGVTGNGDSSIPSTGDFGNIIAFRSDATNLIPQVEIPGQIYAYSTATGSNTLVTVNRFGTGPAFEGGYNPVVSPDERYVLFFSGDRDLVTQNFPAGGTTQLYMRDLVTNTTTLISVTPDGLSAGNDHSGGDKNSSTGGITSSLYGFSGNGRYVVFWSRATNLVTGVTPTSSQLYVRDLLLGTTSLVTTNPDGSPVGRSPGFDTIPFQSLSISQDGRRVAFVSDINGIASSDSNGLDDVFVRDLVAGTTTLVSVNSSGGVPGNERSEDVQLTSDGNRVFFRSLASDLISGETISGVQIYARDLSSSATRLITHKSENPKRGGDLGAGKFTISSDGNLIAFDSASRDLLPGVFDSLNDVFLYNYATDVTTLISRGIEKLDGNDVSFYPVISRDGSKVFFGSEATDLIPGFVNNNSFYPDYYVFERATGTLRLVTHEPEQPVRGGDSTENITFSTNYSTMNADGSVIAFRNLSSNLVNDDDNQAFDVFLETSGKLDVISKRSLSLPAAYSAGGLVIDASSDGRFALLFAGIDYSATSPEVLWIRDTIDGTVIPVPGTDQLNSFLSADLSADGRFVTYASGQVFLFDRITGTVETVSKTPDGNNSSGIFLDTTVSSDGRYVLLTAMATDLIAGFTDGNTSFGDLYLRDRVTGTTTLVNHVPGSITTSGNGNISGVSQFVAENRTIVFDSTSSNLSANDTNGTTGVDVFSYDIASGAVSLISVDSTGIAAGSTSSSEVSADGRYLVFSSIAANVVAGVTGSASHVYVRELLTGTNQLVDINLTGGASDAISRLPDITPDGRYVLFQSTADDLTEGFGTTSATQVFVRDLLTGRTVLASAIHGGVAGGDGLSLLSTDGDSQISANGRYVAFSSTATDLVAGFVDGNGLSRPDLYLRDLITGSTLLVSMNRTGTATGNSSTTADNPFMVFDDGRVLFNSRAGDLSSAFDANGLTDGFLFNPSAPVGGAITGSVFDDLDGDGIRDSGESGRANAVIFLDTDMDGIRDSSEIFVSTSADGSFRFSGLGLNTYDVRQEVGPNTTVTTPASGKHTVTITTDGQTTSGLEFGNLQQLADLSIDSIQVPPVIQPGRTTTVSWQTHNTGSGVAVSGWRDAVYLSADELLDPSDQVVATTIHTTDLNACGVATTTISLNLPRVALGTYHLLIQSDRYTQIQESREDNNLAASNLFTFLPPILQPGQTVTGAFQVGDIEFYEMYLLRGQTIKLHLDAVAGQTELYVVPDLQLTASRSTSQSSDPGSDQTLVFTALQEGSQYVAVRSLSEVAADARGYTLSAEETEFGEITLDVRTVDRGGSATIQLSGVPFSADMTVELNDGMGHQLVASKVMVVSQDSVFVTFDLTQIPAGQYDMKLSQTVNELTANPELSFDDPGFISFSPRLQQFTFTDALTVTEAQPSATSITIAAPDMVRQGRDFSVVVTVTNTSSHDITIPLLKIETDNPLLFLTPAQSPSFSYSSGTAYMLPLSQTGLADVLRPGQRSEVRLYGSTIANTLVSNTHIQANPVVPNDKAVDFTSFVNALGSDASTEQGAMRLANLISNYGTTATTWVAGLLAQARRLGDAGVRLTSAQDLMRLTADEPSVAPTLPLTVSPVPVSSFTPSYESADTQRSEVADGPVTPDLSQLKNRFDELIQKNPLEAIRYDLFNYATGRPGEPLTERQLIDREHILRAVATFMAVAGAPTGSFHLNRFLGDDGPTASPPGLAYFDGDALSNGVRATGEVSDWGYGKINTIVSKLVIPKLMQAKAESLPEGESEVFFTDEIIPKYRELIEAVPIAAEYLKNTGRLALWTYVHGSLSFFNPLLDPQTAIGRVEGTAVFHGTAKKRTDPCGQVTVTFEGNIEYTFPDVYRFSGDGAKGINLVFNTYAEELQTYGYAGVFTDTVIMRDKASGSVNVQTQKRPDKDCSPDLPDTDSTEGARTTVKVLRPVDPNEIVGPGGFGDNHYLAPSDNLLPYTVFFENDPEKATVPAQEVIITHQLDVDLNWSTFELGRFGFGDQVIEIPAGLQSYQTRVDYHNPDGTPLFVDVTANLEPVTGVVTWTFRSVDPATGTLPEGVFDGFLPVNNETEQGEGFVEFSVKQDAGLVTGVSFNQQASIIFDINDPLDTNIFINTIDSGAPVSQVTPLPATTTTSTFTVRWSGNDDLNGSGIGGYDIFVSDNNGPFELWLDNTVLTTANYVGQNGHTYQFYSVATDNVGHAEPLTSSPDATTVVNEVVQLALGTAEVSWTKKQPPVVVLPEVTVGNGSLLNGTLTLSMANAGLKKKPTDSLTLPAIGAWGTSTGLAFARGNLSLTVTLNAEATAADIQTFLRGITFSTKGKGLKKASRTVDIGLTDGNGQTATISQTIRVNKKGKVKKSGN